MICLISVLFLLAYIVLGIALIVHHNDLVLPKPLAYGLLVLFIVGILVLGYVILFFVLFGYNS